MTEVLFLCLWYRDKKKTWSGTAWSLRQAMEPYVKITDFTITDPLYRKIFRKLKKRKSLSPGPTVMDRYRLWRQKGNQIITFQFGDWPEGGRYATYLYQDLSVAAILWLGRQDPQAYRYCEYDGVSVKTLRRRAASQLASYRKSKAVFTMSRWLREFLIRECGLPEEKVYAVGGGINVDATRIHPGEKNGHRILFVGRNFLRKGGVLVVEAYRILQKKYLPEAELYLAGAAEAEIGTALWGKPEIPEAEKGQGIHMLGDLGAEALTEYYNLCDVFCMPSYFEAYGLVFAEALAFGLPCIGRDKFAMREMIEDGHTGKLFSGEDPEKLAEVLWEVLSNPRYREEVEGRREWYLAEYSWDRVAKNICSVMEKNERRDQDQYCSTRI